MGHSKGSRKGISAWLVTWEHCGDHARPERRIAAVLSPRWSAERVREYVELLYVNSIFSLPERIAYARGKSFNPYPAKFASHRGVPCYDPVICGHNPWLEARKVDNLRVDTSEGDSVKWSERQYDYDALFERLGILPGET